MSKEKLESLLFSMNTSEIKDVIKEYNDKCDAEDRKDSKIRGYSKYKKSELIDFFINYLSDSEVNMFIDRLEVKIAKQVSENAAALILGGDKREKIANTTKLDENKNVVGFTLDIKGFQWEETTSVVFDTLKKEFNNKCTCRIGRNGGICKHIMAGILMLYSEDKLSPENFPIHVNNDVLQQLKTKKGMISSQTQSEVEEPDIAFDGYQIFITDEIVTTKWEGDYSGKKIIDIKNEKDDLETWIKKKVYELITKSLHPKKKEGSPRLPITDNWGAISKIMKDKKIVKKMLKKMQDTDPTLPSNSRDLYELLISDLLISNNPSEFEFEEIEYIPKEKK